MFKPSLHKALCERGFTFYADGRIVHKRTHVIITHVDRGLCRLVISWSPGGEGLQLTIPTDKFLGAAGLKAADDAVIIDAIEQQKLAAHDPGQPD
jgi:hypothetical protein